MYVPDLHIDRLKLKSEELSIAITNCRVSRRLPPHSNLLNSVAFRIISVDPTVPNFSLIFILIDFMTPDFCNGMANKCCSSGFRRIRQSH